MWSLRCLSCATSSPDGNRYCEHCGTELAAICPSCGRAAAPSARFCGGCGAPKPDTQAGNPIAQRPGWGELKQATILFADIVSSTERIAELDPEEAMAQLKPAVARMCDVVQANSGTVVRTLGDGIMALFGVPRALEDHATLACQAALAMQDSFRGGSNSLSIRVGLHSGLVVSDPASPDVARGGGAHGLAIHIASRVVGLADPGGICLTRQCLDLLRSAANTRNLGARQIKGVQESYEIHALLAIDDDPAASAYNARRAGLSPFRGRESELAILESALQRAQKGAGQVVGVWGEPGCGKSRLCHEFAQSCHARFIPVHQVRTQPHGHVTPLQPILEIIRSYVLAVPAEAEAGQVRQRVADKLAEAGLRDQRDRELLNDFLGAAEPGSHAAPGQDPRARRARLMQLLDALMRATATQHAVILFEDLHWLDEASEDFVSTLVNAVQGARTLLLLNYRPRSRSPWQSAEHFVPIELRGLSESDTEALVRALLTHQQEFSAMCQTVARRAAGNPFFAEELVRSISQWGAMSSDGAANGPRFGAAGDALPQTVQAVIAARIDRLKDAQKKLLQISAIVGKEVPLEVLRRVAHDEVKDIPAALEVLCRLEFLRASDDVDQQLVFAHPLIQEVAYGMQLKATRSTIHALIGESMESHYAARLDEYSALIGHHYEAAGHKIPAARHIARAARWLSSTDSSAASRQWHRVKSLLQEQERDPEVDQLRMLASSQIAMLGWRDGRTLHEVQPFVDEAKGLAAETDQRLTQMLLLVEGRMLQASGASADEYIHRAKQALALVAPQDIGRRAMINAVLSQAYGRAGLMIEAMAANEVARLDAASIDRFDREFVGFAVEHWIVAMRGRSLARIGELQEAEAAWQQLLQSGVAVDPTIEAIVYLGYVELAWCREEPQLARDHADRLAALAANRQVPYLKVVAQFCTGVAAVIGDDIAVALPALTSALWLVRTNRVAIEFEPDILTAIAECHLRAGNADDARSRVLEAIELSRARGARIAECRALIIQGTLLSGKGDVDAAQACFDQAEELIQRTGATAYKTRVRKARNRPAVQWLERRAG